MVSVCSRAQDDVEPVGERIAFLRGVAVEVRHQRLAARLGQAMNIGSSSSSGSPGKYIWVTSRAAALAPNTEK